MMTICPFKCDLMFIRDQTVSGWKPRVSISLRASVCNVIIHSGSCAPEPSIKLRNLIPLYAQNSRRTPQNPCPARLWHSPTLLEPQAG
jgi:hypothetical protein